MKESFEFKVGDKVKLEGVLVKSTRYNGFPLRMFVSDNLYLDFDINGRYMLDSTKPELQLVSRPKKKVTKWRWVCKCPYSGNLLVTDDKYSVQDSCIMGILIQKIDSTAEEFEVSDD